MIQGTTNILFHIHSIKEYIEGGACIQVYIHTRHGWLFQSSTCPYAVLGEVGIVSLKA